MKWLSRVQLFATAWTAACQAPLPMEFCRQEYWSGLPFLSPGDLPNPGIEPGSPALQADSLPSEPPGRPWKKWGLIKKNPNRSRIVYIAKPRLQVDNLINVYFLMLVLITNEVLQNWISLISGEAFLRTQHWKRKRFIQNGIWNNLF